VSTLLSTATRRRRVDSDLVLLLPPGDAGFSGRDGLSIGRGDQDALSPLLERSSGRNSDQHSVTTAAATQPPTHRPSLAPPGLLRVGCCCCCFCYGV
jgi:hypothetical protein